MKNHNENLDDLDDLDYEQYGWTKTEYGNYTREHELHDSSHGCNLCGGYQDENSDAADYCPHQDQDTYTEQIHIQEDDYKVIIWNGGFRVETFAATTANIIAWIRGTPENISDENTLEEKREQNTQLTDF